MDKLSEEARRLKNEYQRNWKKKNPEKVKKNTLDYWNRKAAGYTVQQKARDLKEKGLSQREIAKQLNVSVGAVNGYLNKD